MHVFADIAAKHGINPQDEAAVDKFFESVATMPVAKQEEILAELLARDSRLG